jgi:hypothetical protein
MSRLAILASVVAVAVISVACADTSGQSNSANSMLTGPSAVALSTSGETAIPAAKGGNGKGKLGDTGDVSSITGPVGANGDSIPNIGDSVTFDVSSTATTSPWVTVTCSQSGTQVYRQSNAVFLVNSTFTLGPTPSWQSGAADCTATLHIWNGPALASLSFQALG